MHPVGLRLAVGLLGCCLAGSTAVATETVATILRGLKNPESVALGNDGKFYISEIGEFGKDGDGAVHRMLVGETEKVAEGLDDPKGLIAWKNNLYVTDKTRVWKIELKGNKKSVLADADAFPITPTFLNDIAVTDDGTLYVSDSGDSKDGSGAAVYRITQAGKVSLVTDPSRAAGMKRPNGLLPDGDDHLFVLDFGSGRLLRVALKDGSAKTIAEGFEGGDGLARDVDGNLYITQWTTGGVWFLPPGAKQAELLTDQLDSAADCCLDLRNGYIVIPDMKAGTLNQIAVRSAAPREIDTAALPVKIEPAFNNLEFNRPIVLTHAGDGTNRVFVASQLGKIYVFANNQQVTAPKLFIDLEPKVEYKDRENEEGLLGLAFHPRYKQTGEFFVYYTTREAPHVSVVSRFRVSKDDPNRADPASEEELLRIQQPFWNHNGGTIAFGPDGYLYIALGDGGSGGDPQGNGQNLKTWLGSILRIDVDRRDGKQPYGIPADNPFVGRKGALPEIYAYGLRNVWRITFDRKTGMGWVADVGQNIWEEVNLLAPGGNYGWNVREGMHRYTFEGAPPSDDLIDPIWEYHHAIGKSITGGHVYRGKRVPALTGKYLYADYVTGQVYALQYDEKQGRVTGNHPIEGNIQPVLSFGEDEMGEVYFLTVNGKLHHFSPGK